MIVPRSWGEHGLWRTSEQLLEDPMRYAALSRAAYYRPRDYLPTTVAEDIPKGGVVMPAGVPLLLVTVTTCSGVRRSVSPPRSSPAT
ncbi:MAG: hypothetical protein ACRDRK_03450 [Pseudonocardia sp.]